MDPASVPPGKTKADFLQCLSALSCTGCQAPGATTAQCCACGLGVCGACVQACHKKDDASCPFALCPACDEEHSCGFFPALAQGERPGVPGLVAPACTKCAPDAKTCPACTESACMFCEECRDVRCMLHSFEYPMVSFCVSCNARLCARPECGRASGKRLVFCMQCGLWTCSQCLASDGCGECALRYG